MLEPYIGMGFSLSPARLLLAQGHCSQVPEVSFLPLLLSRIPVICPEWNKEIVADQLRKSGCYHIIERHTAVSVLRALAQLQCIKWTKRKERLESGTLVR